MPFKVFLFIMIFRHKSQTCFTSRRFKWNRFSLMPSWCSKCSQSIMIICSPANIVKLSSTVTISHNFQVDYNSQWLWLFAMLLKLLISFHILSEKESCYFLMDPFNDWYHLSNLELRVRSLQMFGRTLVNLAHQSGPHTVGINASEMLVAPRISEYFLKFWN